MLSGEFSGVSDSGGDDEEPEECDEFRGVVLQVGDRRLVMERGEQRIVVAVTEETEFEGFKELSELAEGDVVVVEGCWDGDVLVAWWIVLAEDADAPVEVEHDGTVLAVTEQGFDLDIGDFVIAVVVTEDTDFVDVSGLAELAQGDVVFVEGIEEDSVLLAFLVKLLERGGEED